MHSNLIHDNHMFACQLKCKKNNQNLNCTVSPFLRMQTNLPCFMDVLYSTCTWWQIFWDYSLHPWVKSLFFGSMLVQKMENVLDMDHIWQCIYFGKYRKIVPVRHFSMSNCFLDSTPPHQWQTWKWHVCYLDQIVLNLV